MAGDPSIRQQVMRDLQNSSPGKVQAEARKVASEGWGALILSKQDISGLFGGGLYSPKWTSTTYSMLLLRRLGLPRDEKRAHISRDILIDRGFNKSDGGINFWNSRKQSETCVTGLVLAILSYFRCDDPRMEELVEYLLREQMTDGGWNCLRDQGAVHSSFHTTINVLDGLLEFEREHPEYKLSLTASRDKAVEFLLEHHLYQSHRTRKTVDKRMVMLSFPPRWRYDILRALDFFREVRINYDPRMDNALEILKKKRRSDGTWPLQCNHPGRTFFMMEKAGKPSRWNTLRALRVLDAFG